MLWPQDTGDLLRHTVKSESKKDIDVYISVPQEKGRISVVRDKLSLTLPALTCSSALLSLKNSKIIRSEENYGYLLGNKGFNFAIYHSNIRRSTVIIIM